MEPIIETYTGQAFNLENPKPEMVNIIDITYALSNICRFTGHTKYFYSVAEHSARMAISGELQVSPMDCLLHDAAEAYIGDINSPLKEMLRPDIVRIEERILAVISEALNWKIRDHKAVKAADLRMLATEVRDLMSGKISEWNIIREIQPLKGIIVPWPNHVARRNFIKAYKLLRSR